MKKDANYMEIKFKAISENEAFARTCVAAFCLPLQPTLDEINDIKTAVSEAVTNSVVHAYSNGDGEVTLSAAYNNGQLTISVSDKGVGIKNFDQAREPFFTTRPNEERSGMGFTIMESFMDELKLEKNDDKGLKVIMKKAIKQSAPERQTC